MGHTHRSTATDRRERGANLVEMALMLPFLLLLFMGIADLGRGFYTKVSLINAAREGARFAARYPFEGIETEVKEVILLRVRDEPSIPGVTWDNVDVEVAGLMVDGVRAASGEPVTVTASVPYPTVLGGMFGLPSITVRSQATMIIFGVDGAS